MLPTNSRLSSAVVIPLNQVPSVRHLIFLTEPLSGLSYTFKGREPEYSCNAVTSAYLQPCKDSLLTTLACFFQQPCEQAYQGFLILRFPSLMQAYRHLYVLASKHCVHPVHIQIQGAFSSLHSTGFLFTNCVSCRPRGTCMCWRQSQAACVQWM